MTPANGFAEMKDSGILGCGSIPSHWETIALKYVALLDGKVDTSNITPEDTVSFVPMECIRNDKRIPKTAQKSKDNGTYSSFCNGDIAIAKVTPCFENGNICVMASLENGYAFGSSELFSVRPQNIVGRYLFYSLQTPYFLDGGAATMTGVGGLKRVSSYYMKNVKIVFPPLSEQSTIASYLDAQCAKIDEIIAQDKASIEDYKQWKASIIYEAVTKGLDSNVEMKDSGIPWIGKVPTHWRVTKIKNFVSIRSGITLGKQYHPGTQLISCPYLRVANVKAEYVDLQDVATIMVTSEEAEKYALKSGELLMTEGGDRDKLGRGTIWHGEIPGCLHQNHVFAVQVNEKYMLTKFLDYLTASPVGREYFDLTAKKTTNLASTNSTTILQFSVPIPPLTEQEKIIAILDRNTATINEVIAEKETLVSDLESYKKSLIYEVVTGKRRVC